MPTHRRKAKQKRTKIKSTRKVAEEEGLRVSERNRERVGREKEERENRVTPSVYVCISKLIAFLLRPVCHDRVRYKRWALRINWSISLFTDRAKSAAILTRPLPIIDRLWFSFRNTKNRRDLKGCFRIKSIASKDEFLLSSYNPNPRNKRKYMPFNFSASLFRVTICLLWTAEWTKCWINCTNLRHTWKPSNSNIFFFDSRDEFDRDRGYGLWQRFYDTVGASRTI